MSERNPFKLVTVGDHGTEKIELFISYACGICPTDYIPTVFDNYKCSIEVNGKTIYLELWDTSDQEAYEHLRVLSYPNTDMFLLCYSCIDRTTFDNLDMWYNELTKYWNDEKRQLPVILVGTQKELVDDPDTLAKIGEKGVITMKEAQTAARKYNAVGCFQCSTKTHENVEGIFKTAIKDILKKKSVDRKSACCWQ